MLALQGYSSSGESGDEETDQSNPSSTTEVLDYEYKPLASTTLSIQIRSDPVVETTVSFSYYNYNFN